MSNLNNTHGIDEGASGKEIRVTYVSREGEILGQKLYTPETVEEARRIPRGNRIPYLPKPDWKLYDISEDGCTWTIDTH